MFTVTGEARYLDTFETVLYNAFAAGCPSTAGRSSTTTRCNAALAGKAAKAGSAAPAAPRTWSAGWLN
jgi:hypothetical protein